MGSVRIRHEFDTDQNVRYRVDIWDSDWAGATTTTFEADGFEIEYDYAEAFLSPLIPSSCYFRLYHDYSSTFNIFVADLANAQEDEFKMIVYKYNGATWDIYWAGVIMSDLISWDNTDKPIFEIIAKDGLNRLEDIYFDKILSTPYTSDYGAKVIKIIFDCLSYAATAQFWNGASKPYIAVTMASHDTLQTAITQADILTYIWVGKEYLIEDPAYDKNYGGVKFKGDNEHPLKAKQILFEILQLFRLRIILSEGSWRIQEVNQFTYTSYSQGEYDYLGAYTGVTVGNVKLTENGTTLKVLANGKFGYYPPVRSAKAKIFPSTILNGTFALNSRINVDNLTFTSSTFNLGKLYGGGGTGLQLAIQIDYDILRWFWKVGKDFYVEVTAKISANTNRITNSILTGIEATAPHKGGGAKWSTTSADKYTGNIYYAMNFSASGKNMIADRPDSFIIRTEEIPFAAEDATLVITATLKSVTGSTNWPIKGDLDFNFKNVIVQLIDTAADPPIIGTISEIELESPYVAANSIAVDYGMLRICDNLLSTTQAQFNTIMVNAPGVASGLVGTTTWDAGYTVDTDLVSTLLKETIALQKTAIKKYTGYFRSTIYNAWNTISYDSEIWVFMGGRYNAKTDTWNGQWFAIAHDFAVITASTARENEVAGKTVRVKEWRKPFDPATSLPTGPVPMAKTSAKKSVGDTVTSFNVDTIAFRHIRSGDNIYLLNPITMENTQGFAVSADVEIGDTSVSITSEAATEDIWQGFYMAHDPREVVASNILRSNYLQLQKQAEQGIGYGYNQTWHLKANTTGTATTPLTTDGLGISGITNVPLIPIDCAVAGIVHVTVKEESRNTCGQYIRQFLVVNDAGASTFEGTVQTIGTDIASAGIAGATVTVTLDDTNDYISVDVVGVAATNLKWSARLELVISNYA